MQFDHIKEFVALSRRIVRPEESENIIDGNNINNNIGYTAEQERIMEFLDSLTFEELQEIEALVMLGKSFYHDEPWDGIRRNVDVTKEAIVGYLMGLADERLPAKLLEGFKRLLEQAQ